MKKHLIISLIFLMPLLSQKLENKSSSDNNTSISLNEVSSLSVPRKVSYQGILTKSNGQPVSDSVYEVKFRLYKTAEDGEHFWEEIQSIVVNDGLISATLGIVNNLNNIPNETYLEVEVEGSVLLPRQEMTAVFYSVISDTAYHAKGYTPTIDMGTLSFQDTNQVDITGGKINGAVIGEDDPRAAKFSEVDVSGVITADVFVGSAAGLTGIVAADSIGVIAGENPFTMEGITVDDYETLLYVEDPTEDRVVTIPNVSGTIITTGNFPIDLTIHGGRIDSTNIGDSIPALGRFSELTTLEGININDGNTVLSNVELGVLDGVTQGQVQAGKVLTASDDRDITGLRNITSTGSIVAESFSGMFMGDGSGITGVSATSIGTLIGDSPLIFDGEVMDNYKTAIQIEEPTSNEIITIPNTSGIVITTGNDELIDKVGVIDSGVWEGEIISDAFVTDSLSISNGVINGTSIGFSQPDSGRFTNITSVNGIKLDDGNLDISVEEMSYIDGVSIGQAAENKVLVPDRNLSISGLRNIFLEDNFFSSLVGVDNVVIDNSSIGYVDDRDLITLSDENVLVQGTIEANSFSGDGSSLTGVNATAVGILDGEQPLKFEGVNQDEFQTTLFISEPTKDQNILLPNVSGTIITTGNKADIDTVGVLTDGQWQASVIQDPYITDNLRIYAGSIDSTEIGKNSPASGKFTSAHALDSISGSTLTDGVASLNAGSLNGLVDVNASGAITGSRLSDGTAILENGSINSLNNIDASGTIRGSSFTDGTAILVDGDLSGVISLDVAGNINGGTISLDDNSSIITKEELNVLDGAIRGTASSSKALVADGNKDITGLRNISVSGTINASDFSGSFSGDGAGLSGVLATEIGVLAGQEPLEFEGATPNPFETKLAITDPTQDRTITLPDVSGIVITTGNKAIIDTVGTITDGIWQASQVQDTYIADNLTISGGSVNNTVIGSLAPEEGNFTNVNATAVTSTSLTDGTATMSSGSITGLDDLTATGTIEGQTITDGTATLLNGSLSGATAVTASGAVTGGSITDGTTTMFNGTITGTTGITVDGTVAATALTGDGSGITGVSASSIKSDDIIAGDAAVTISTSTGAINLTPADGSAIVLDGAVNVDAGVVTGVSSLTASGALTGGSLTDGTATIDDGAVTGVTTITGSGLATVGALDVDDVLVDGALIGHTDDPNLMTLSNGQVAVDGTVAATALTGDGSGITGVSASSIKSDDIIAGDAAVTISTSTGGVNITPADGSAIVLDGAVNVDAGVVTGVSSLTVSGEASVTTLDIGGTDVTATAAELNVLDGSLKENNSIWIGNDPASTTDAAQKNIAVGTTALDAITTGDDIVAIGYDALTENTEGYSNTAIGSGSLADNTTGDRNTAIGANALKSNTTGIVNVAVGSSALESNTTANRNTAVGHASSFKLNSGQNNVTLGYEASKNMTSANNNVIVGSDANPSADTGTSNQIVIGYGTTGKGNNTVTIGNGDITTWTPTDDGEVDLGSSSAEFKDLYVDGVAYTDAIGFGTTAMTLPTADGSDGQVLVTDGGGALSWSSTAGNATRASTLTITDNENTNESNALVFTAGGDVDGGDLGLESDGDATYNPSTGVITATGFSGNLTGTLQTAAQTNVTSLGTLSGLTVSGEASVTTLDIGGTDVTSTAAELNVLDGVTATAVELNIMDGGTSATSTTIVDADRLILNDDGTMKQIAMTDLASYVASGSDLDILADAKSGGTNFTESLLLGHETTGTLNAAEYNTGVGRGSLDALTEGDNNTAAGYNSLSANTTGTGNVAFGYNTLAANTTADQNLAIGYNALAVQTSDGSFNTAVGNYSLDANTIGDKNVALGYNTLSGNSEGSFNVGIGAEALKVNNTGANNTALGNAAGDVITTGSNNVVIGSGSDPSAANGLNQTVVGYDATGQANNSVTLGNADVTAVYMGEDAGATVHAAGVTSASNGNIAIDPNGSGTLALGSADNTAVTADALAITATSVNALTLTDGTASFALGGTGATTLSGATTVDLDGTGAMSLNSSAGVINIGNDDIDQNINIGTQGERTINIGSSSATKVDFGAGKIDNYSANVETGTTESNALAIGASYNGTVLLIADDSAVQTLTLADDLPVGFNFMVVQKGNYKIKMAAATATDLVGQGITNGTSGYIWSNGKYSVITIVVIADGEYVMTGDRSNSAS